MFFKKSEAICNPDLDSKIKPNVNCLVKDWVRFIWTIWNYVFCGGGIFLCVHDDLIQMLIMWINTWGDKWTKVRKSGLRICFSIQ